MFCRQITKLGLIACMAVHGLLGCAAEVESSVLEPDELAPGEVDPGEAQDGDELGLVREGILGGIQTTSFPAVGRLSVTSRGVCTGTLIASNVVLTAAHCFGYDQSLSNLGSGTTPPNNNFSGVSAFFKMFNQFPPSGMQQTLELSVRRVYVIGSSLGASDLAIAQLDREVPANYATPYAVATSTPAQGALVQGVGYGCTTPGGPGGSTKTYRGALWQSATLNTSPNLGCVGDSGGPIINSSAQIVAVISGPGSAPNTDSFALPTQHRATIDRIKAIYGVRQVCTSCPIISFRTYDGRHFLQAPDNGGANAVINATPTAVGEWEQFRIVQFSRTVPQAIPTWVALQARSGRFVSTPGNGSGNVKTSSDQIYTNELFYMEPRSGGGRTLRTNHFPTRYYLTAENGGGGTVSSNRTVASIWETFY